jgi:hypothetical protein
MHFIRVIGFFSQRESHRDLGVHERLMIALAG